MEEKEQNVKDLLKEELVNEIQAISSMEAGSEEQQRAVDNFSILYKLNLDQEKIDNDLDQREKQRDFEYAKEEQRIDEDRERKAEEKKNKYIQWGIDIASLVLPLSLYTKWLSKGFKFEQTGTFTSTTFRDLLKHIKPRR